MRGPEPDVLQDRHDAHEQVAAEHALRLAVADVGPHLVGQVEALPDLLAQEPVTHAVAGVHAELLALVSLGGGELGVVVAKRQATKHDVACLVLHHIGVHRLGERLARHVADGAKAARASPSISTCMPR